MAFAFTPDMITGNGLIDSEHKKLFEAINAMLDACQNGKGRQELEHAVDFMAGYTKTHFAHEENLQLQSKYPDYPAHKVFHTGYLEQIDILAKNLKEKGATISILGDFNSKISILVRHIKTEDVKIANHVKQAK